MSLRVYLSGGMEYSPNEGEEWRSQMHRWLEEELGHNVFNPNVESRNFFSKAYPGIDFRALKRENVDAYRQIICQLVMIDCGEIATRSDYVICYWDEGAALGAGTKGELTIARYFGKPVYLITSIPPEELPGWVLGCTSHHFVSFVAAKSFILQTYGRPHPPLP